jgi:hypothetical protein
MSLTMKNRVSNAPTNLTRRFEARYRAQRQGQALLLAVVVMLFVALISAGFLATVSGNLNQTARTSEKNRAIESAKAGMAYINNRINTSAEGENWRPTLPTVLPTGYYNAAAQAQNIAGSGYVLYPESNLKATGEVNNEIDSPQFYARVQRIGYSNAQRISLNQATPLSDPEAQRAGTLKIEIFGISKTDPNVFHRMVAYRGGYDGAPIGRVMRSVSNYDFKNKVVPVAIVDSDAAAGSTSLTLADDPTFKGVFPKENFAVVISNPTATTVQSVAVDSYNPTTKTITFPAPGLSQAVTAGDRVELAANLGAPERLDYNRDNVAEADLLVDSTSNALAPLSAKINGGVYWQGNLTMRNLRSKTDAYSTGTAPQTIEASGLMVAPTPIPGPTTSSSVIAGDTATAIVPDSTLLTGTLTEDNLVSDGRSNIINDLSPTRKTKSFTPPDLTSEANLARYRGLSRDSKPAVSSAPSEAANYGYGQGIYISNGSDREKIYDTALGKYREMYQNELMELWYSNDTNHKHGRLGTPDDPITAANIQSLEELHLRGWVSRDEFLPRGALVELNPSNRTITITLEKRSDGATNNMGPVAAKAWRDQSGNTLTGVYQRVLPWPTNGVLFAEGNIRIKGGVNEPDGADIDVDPGNSLTVVSLGNIYVEGSLNAGGTTPKRKILLLARKNVLVNPTRVIGRVDAQTVANTTVTDFTVSATPISLPVHDTSEFKVGDVIEVESCGRAVVTAISTTTELNLRVLTSQGTVNVTNPAVRTASENYDSVTGKTSIANAGDAIQRRLTIPVLDANTRLIFDHKAERRTGMTVQAVAVPPKELPDVTSPIWLANKTAAGKQMIGSFTLPNAGSDPFPATPHTDDATANNYTVQSLVTDVSGGSGPIHSDTTYEWKYDSGFAVGYGTIPAHYLASIGLLVPITSDVAGDRRKQLNGVTPLPYEIPVATSITPTINGTAVNLTDNFGPLPQVSNQFGFAPVWTNANEDRITSDRTFYEATANFLDSRSFASAGFTGTGDNFVLRQSDDLIGFSTGAPLPTYQIGRLRLENLDSTTGNINPAVTFDIRAFVYAQEGSWLVVTGDYFNTVGDNAAATSLKGDAAKTYYDINNNNTPDVGEYIDVDNSNTFTDGDIADLNRDGIRNEGEFASLSDNVARFARYNYKIQFKGTISENHTALVNNLTPTNSVSVSNWLDKWANYSSTGGTGTWTPITYQFDADYAIGTLENDPGFRMPVANDILYQE